MEIDKQDWEDLKKQLQIQHKNMLLSLEQDLTLIALCDRKLDEFLLSEVKDNPPKEIKEIAKEVKK